MPSPSNRRHPGTCRHCCRWMVLWPRGLCWHCYYRAGVRGLYPSASRFHGARMSGWADDHGGDQGTPGEPTGADPGTEEKIRAMAGRAAKRQVLFHPLDRRLPLQ